MSNSSALTASIFIATATLALATGCGSSQKSDAPTRGRLDAGVAADARDAGVVADAAVRADSQTSTDAPASGKDAARVDAVGVSFDAPSGVDASLAMDGPRAFDATPASMDGHPSGMDVMIDSAPEARPQPNDAAVPADVAQPADAGRDKATPVDGSAKKTDLPAGAQAIRDFEVMPLSDFPYQCFVKNWDYESYPVFYALIQSDADFDAYFGAAGVMGPTLPYAPSADDFSKYSYILVSRVVPASPVRITFQVDGLMAGGGEVGLFYTFKQGDGSSTWDIKDGMLVRFPKRKIDQVVVYENQAPLGILDAAAGKNDVTLN